jgi:hypothetical protein
MKPRGLFVPALALGICVVAGLPLAYGQKEYHGADSVFEGQGVAVLWAILKGPDEDHSWVYIRMINSGVHPPLFHSYSVQAVDPFSNEKEWVVNKMGWKKDNTVKASRSSFKDKSARRILFYRDTGEDPQEKPAMTVFYMGIPDTTPELLTETQLEDYFRKAIERLKKH